MTAADADRSDGFARLSTPVRRWVHGQAWRSLRDIQEQSIEPILAGEDVIVASATASGKTEAAFLPLMSREPAPGRSHGLRVLGVSPLKALINDQERRLESLVEAVGTTVMPWHGDVAGSRKAEFAKRPSGVLLITPESLEAMFVTRGSAVADVFKGLDYVVVDELHSFIGAERGRQLQSLLHRVELASGRRVPRIGLSATLGDLTIAKEFLRPGEGAGIRVVESTVRRHQTRVRIHGYEKPAAAPSEDEMDADELAIADDMYGQLRGGKHIGFANSRASVETYVRLLNDRAELAGTATEFWAHHGNLAKDIREDAELALRGSRPAPSSRPRRSSWASMSAASPASRRSVRRPLSPRSGSDSAAPDA